MAIVKKKKKQAEPEADLRGYGETVLTPKPLQVTLVFLTEKNAYKGKEQSYQLTALIDKDDDESLEFFNQYLCEYYEVKDVSVIPFHPFCHGKTGEPNDGDDEQFAEYKGYANRVFCKFTTNQEEIFENIFTDVEMDGSECKRRVADPEEIHAGCFCVLAFNAKEYDEGKVKFYLQGLVKTDKGEVWSMGKDTTKNLLGMSGKKGKVDDEDKKKNAQKALLGTKSSALKKAKASQQDEDDEDGIEEDDEDEEEEAPRKKSKLPFKKKVPIDDDEDEEEEVDEDEDEEEEPAPRKKSKGLIPKRKAPVEEDEDDEDEEEDDEDEEPAPRKKGKPGRPPLKKKARVEEDDEDEEEDEEEEEAPRKKNSIAKAKKAPFNPPKKGAVAKKATGLGSLLQRPKK